MSEARKPPARTRLLDAADRVLFERGIRATPVDDLLREAGVSVSTLYTHFGSKDGLVAEVLGTRLHDWRLVWDRCVVAAHDDEGRLLAIFDAVATYREEQYHPAGWCAFLAAADELPSAPEGIAQVLSSHTDLLAEGLLHLARPLTQDQGAAQELADDVALIYTGVLASYLRGYPGSPVDGGRRAARAAVQARHAR
ncbi:TetR/AcrR family transcriptional regulator [Nesterenkonia sp. E16_7]|uniref:TetR/AcrR family transcriptional regulator n=1 Tax=unclassified Nesterenkonia TaxID=2629769 RepID=UPI001A91CDCA|nr:MULTISPECIES: TetR/AcrR family transcriptional regulator [unclassified Nesterenkonia]MBO0594706.1 TetR/AcrR family transcriptional regulator [Nesterenkonia sp. E16_10]MBO0597455.1 TetR/AcrR family transcriptional regulator [Nesterenkonia sp. E16_7]